MNGCARWVEAVASVEIWEELDVSDVICGFIISCSVRGGSDDVSLCGVGGFVDERVVDHFDDVI